MENFEFAAFMMDIAPIPPVEPGVFAKLAAAVSAFVGGIVWSAYKLIFKIKNNKRGDKK